MRVCGIGNYSPDFWIEAVIISLNRLLLRFLQALWVYAATSPEIFIVIPRDFSTWLKVESLGLPPSESIL